VALTSDISIRAAILNRSFEISPQFFFLSNGAISAMPDGLPGIPWYSEMSDAAIDNSPEGWREENRSLSLMRLLRVSSGTHADQGREPFSRLRPGRQHYWELHRPGQAQADRSLRQFKRKRDELLNEALLFGPDPRYIVFAESETRDQQRNLDCRLHIALAAPHGVKSG
jgi:hypothetical protein